jgi:hypothetical protein
MCKGLTLKTSGIGKPTIKTDNRSTYISVHETSKLFKQYILRFLLPALILLSSCKTLDKASIHGFNSGFYEMEEDKIKSNVFVDVLEDSIGIYKLEKAEVSNNRYMMIPLGESDSLFERPIIFRKQGLDVDLTTILLKISIWRYMEVGDATNSR